MENEKIIKQNSASVSIRKMCLEDYDRVYALWLSCEGMGLNNIDDSQDGIAKYLRRNPETCFVAEKDRDLLGVILSGHDGRRGYIHHTAVKPSARGQGIGRRLVEAALQSLKKEGIIKVALVVFERNQTGNQFWERLGFSLREDLCYRNKALTEIQRIDT